jgi:hypothetical protein
LLATLESIHGADILHGDIRLPNLCITPSGDTFVVDFSHATESRSLKEKAQEIRELTDILEMESPTKPAAKDVEKPVLRRSARNKGSERKVDLSHATESRSLKEKVQEIRELKNILEMDSPTKPPAKDIEKPALRRGARNKGSERKAKVEPKNEQATSKRGKSAHRK